ncbi:hypothetical protein DNU06_10050 [Putridiphycobacter roseus]|uniref:Uncharacterized protein n=1 Tax=Putridiphycobacter roseus TaxID=2219161 RepID=A0A2W1MYW5_9FLAO|nr:hypothetical protein [Putridiphycobacter roseus]PZE17077.1 hypothetical protein DNU06_10050 [Putridiphycobacter roseus]
MISEKIYCVLTHPEQLVLHDLIELQVQSLTSILKNDCGEVDLIFKLKQSEVSPHQFNMHISKELNYFKSLIGNYEGIFLAKKSHASLRHILFHAEDSLLPIHGINVKSIWKKFFQYEKFCQIILN